MTGAVGWLGRVIVLAASLAVASSLTLGIGASPWQIVSWLGRYGSPVHAVIAGCLIAAPLVLLVGAVVRRRTPWPWVGATALFLLALTIAVARFPHLVPPRGWVLLAVLLVAALASVVTAFPADADRDQSVSDLD